MKTIFETMDTETKAKLDRKPRGYLEKYPDGRMVICPSTPGKQNEGRYYGEEFLLRYSAWGFVNLARKPDYFGLYISFPVQAVKYFGVVKEIIDPMEEEHPVEDFKDYEQYNDGDKLIMLESDSIIELDDKIPFKSDRLLGFRYTTLNRFIEANDTQELFK